METRRIRWSGAALVVGGVIVVDQLAKILAVAVDAPVVVQARNPGLVLGIFRAPVLVLLLGTFVVLATFLAVVGRWAVQVGISPCIPALIAGGLVANALDRARFGAVRDFLATPWAIVNLADIAVLAGMVGLGVALAFRLHHLSRTSRTIALEPRWLRATIVSVNA